MNLIAYRYHRPARPLTVAKIPVQVWVYPPLAGWLGYDMGGRILAAFGIPFASVFGFGLAILAFVAVAVWWWRACLDNPYAGQEHIWRVAGRCRRLLWRFCRFGGKQKGIDFYVP